MRELRRIGKRIAIGVEGDLWLVLHLMIAGRLHWRARQAKLAGRKSLAAFDFPTGSLVLTEAGTKHRASLSVLAGEEALRSVDPGGIDVFASDLDSFREALTVENRTLKRALTDPRIVSGIGNAYSDEILHSAQLSPITLTHKLQPQEWERLSLRPATRSSSGWTGCAPRRRRLSGKGDCVPQGHGGPWTLWRALSEVWRKDPAHSLCGQRNQLLCPMPNGWETSCRSQFVPAIEIGLAADARGAGVAQAPLEHRVRRTIAKSVGRGRPPHTSHYSSSSFTSPRAALAFSTIFSCSIPGTAS